MLLIKRADSVKMLIFNSAIMRNLMMDLLDLAQMENNTFKLNKSFFSVFDAIDKAFNVVSHVAQRKSVTLERSVLKDGNDNDQYYSQIYGDEGRFMQVIINFLSNSLKFSSYGSKIKVFLRMLENQTIKVGKSKMNNLIHEPIKKSSSSNILSKKVADPLRYIISGLAKSAENGAVVSEEFYGQSWKIHAY